MYNEALNPDIILAWKGTVGTVRPLAKELLAIDSYWKRKIVFVIM